MLHRASSTIDSARSSPRPALLPTHRIAGPPDEERAVLPSLSEISTFPTSSGSARGALAGSTSPRKNGARTPAAATRPLRFAHASRPSRAVPLGSAVPTRLARKMLRDRDQDGLPGTITHPPQVLRCGNFTPAAPQDPKDDLCRR